MKTLKIEELSKNFGTTEVLKKINLDIDEKNEIKECQKKSKINLIKNKLNKLKRCIVSLNPVLLQRYFEHR